MKKQSVIKIEKLKGSRYRILLRPTEVYEIEFEMPGMSKRMNLEKITKRIAIKLSHTVLGQMKKDYCRAIVEACMDYYKGEQKEIVKRMRK